MESMGTLELNWTQGYSGSKAQYINKQTLCFSCGNNIKFYNAEDKKEAIFPSPGEGIGVISVSGPNHVVAVAEQRINPRIFVCTFPEFRQKSVCADQAILEYKAMAFSYTGNYLVSCTGIPDFKINVWNWSTGELLCSASLGEASVESVTFNPIDWHYMCTVSGDKVTIWNIDQCNNIYKITPSEVKLPAVDGTIAESNTHQELAVSRLSRTTTRLAEHSVTVNRAAITALDSQTAADFVSIFEEVKELVVPTSQCWSSKGEVCVGCRGGQLISVDAESLAVTILYLPPPDGSMSEALLYEGSLNAMALHKNALYVGGEDGTMRALEVNTGGAGGAQVAVLESWECGGVPITSLCWSTDYSRLAIGSTKGSIHTYDPTTSQPLQRLFDIHHGDFIGIGILAPGLVPVQQCVSVRENGEVQVWLLERAKLESSININAPASCMACSPSSRTVVVGTFSGHVYFVDFTKLDAPRIVSRLHLYEGPVLRLTFDNEGRFLLSGSDSGHVYVVDPRPSANFKVKGFIEVEGQVDTINCHTLEKNGDVRVVIASNPNPKDNPAATKLVQLDLKKEFAEDTLDPEFYANSKKNFKDSAMNRMTLNFLSPSSGAVVSDGRKLFSLSSNTKKLYTTTMPAEPPKKAMNKASYLHPMGEYQAHQLPGGSVTLSDDGRWIATCSPDGRFTIRDSKSPESFVSVVAHSYRTGGINTIQFSADSMYLVSCGVSDGMLSCYRWNLTEEGKEKMTASVDYSKAFQNMMKGVRNAEDKAVANMAESTNLEFSGKQSSRATSAAERSSMLKSEKEKAIESDQIYVTPTPTAGEDPTWMEVTEIEALKAEDNKYAGTKKQLRTEIRDLRRQIQSMMKVNETLPDIEQLERSEFNLDVEEQERLIVEGDSEVQEVQETIEFDNLAKSFVREVIKKECWDDMVVKGRCLKSFHTGLVVNNFPMKERYREVLNELAFVTKQRQIEIAEAQARKEITESASKSGLTPQTGSKEEEAKGEDDDSEEGEEEPPAMTGSLSAQYGGASPLLYSQFELNSKTQKKNQIILLEDVIYRIKIQFNKTFDEIYKQKDGEITRIREKNSRIKKILLDLEGNKEVIWQPEWSIDEKPEWLLTVNDDEVKVEKFITPEQRAKLEEEARLEAERKAREKGDNARERALDMMMGGVLEVKKEDELKKDIPPPSFMVNKEQDEWSDEEKKLAQDYEKKVKELAEEREKYRKMLESEVKKLQTLISDTSTNFDSKLAELSLKKVNTDMVIRQEELKIVRIKNSLLIEEELGNKEEELNRQIKAKQREKIKNQELLKEARLEVEKYKDEFDIFVAEDRVMDKSFKRNFSEVQPHLIDQLYKCYRRRPRVGRREMRPVGATPVFESSASNPYGDRPISGRHGSQLPVILKALEELDHPQHMPEGIELAVWNKMCHARRQRVESEDQVKYKQLVLADMQDYLKRRQEEDETVKNQLDYMMELRERLQEEKLRFSCNLEIQFLLKQGQVEVEPGQFIYDHSDSILIHRGVVEDLNGTIRQLGEQKITAMTESKDFRKGIHILDWEHKKNIMQIQDLQKKARDIQTLKLSRELQAYLNDENHEAKKQQEIAVLEKTLETQVRHHEKNVAENKHTITGLRRNIAMKTLENQELAGNLEELNVTVSERKHIHEVNAEKRSDAGSERKMHDIVQRRKLVDLAKAQAQEVAVLRAEVERLRMRTFPALVQVEH